MKHVVGFTLIGASVWLFDTFQNNVSPAAANGFLWFLLALAFALWAWEQHAQRDSSPNVRRVFTGVCLAVVGGVGSYTISFEPMPKTVLATVEPLVKGVRVTSVVDGKIMWANYSKVARDTAAKQGRPVFVDFTAKWCVSCKTFEKTHLSTRAMADAFDRSGVLAMKADLTGSNDELWALLKGLNRSGIPAYVIYLPDGSFDLLPEGPPLTLKERLKKASETYPPEKFAYEG